MNPPQLKFFIPSELPLKKKKRRFSPTFLMAVQTEAEGEVGIVPLVDFANSAVETWDRWLDGVRPAWLPGWLCNLRSPPKKTHRILLFFDQI